jgi:hypothetical protein
VRSSAARSPPAFAAPRDWPLALPASTLAGAAGATILVGALAGAYPATRPAPMSDSRPRHHLTPLGRISVAMAAMLRRQ